MYDCNFIKNQLIILNNLSKKSKAQSNITLQIFAAISKRNYQYSPINIFLYFFVGKLLDTARQPKQRLLIEQFINVATDTSKLVMNVSQVSLILKTQSRRVILKTAYFENVEKKSLHHKCCFQYSHDILNPVQDGCAGGGGGDCHS